MIIIPDKYPFPQQEPGDSNWYICGMMLFMWSSSCNANAKLKVKFWQDIMTLSPPSQATH